MRPLQRYSLGRNLVQMGPLVLMCTELSSPTMDSSPGHQHLFPHGMLTLGLSARLDLTVEPELARPMDEPEHAEEETWSPSR